MITKRGKPLSKLVPIKEDADEIYNFIRDRGAITGDVVVSPAITLEEWGKLK